MIDHFGTGAVPTSTLGRCRIVGGRDVLDPLDHALDGRQEPASVPRLGFERPNGSIR
jgi:hypothetical protein